MFKRNICFIIISIFALNFTCLVYSQEEVILQEINVKDGDTLWGVANYYLKDPRAWPEILKYNKLPSSDPDVILPGMKLKIPVKLVKEHLRPAKLIFYLNNVSFKKKDESQWKKAILNMELYNEDSIRTMSQSRADIKFLTGELIRVDENSLIVLRPEKAREEVELFSGTVRASKAKVIAEGAIIEPKIEPKGPNPDYKTKIKEDKTTLVEVYEGTVDVSAQGKTVTLKKGFGTEVKFLSPPSPPKSLPPQPELNMNGMSINKDGLRFNLSDEKNSKAISELRIVKCHLQISEDEKFNKILIDEKKDIKDITEFELKKYNLSDGIYFYRFSYIDELGFEGKFTQPQIFTVDTTPPILEIIRPQTGIQVTDDSILIEGKTEPDCTVKIDENTLKLQQDGKFSLNYTLKKGKNSIKISSKDKSGNITNKEIEVIRESKQQITSEENDNTEKKWYSTPTGILIASATITIIVVVLTYMFAP